jgi:hypothetical protein
MIAALYLEKPRKIKLFREKKKTQWAPNTQIVQYLAEDSCWFYMVGTNYFLNTWCAFNNYTALNSKIPRAHSQLNPLSRRAPAISSQAVPNFLCQSKKYKISTVTKKYSNHKFLPHSQLCMLNYKSNLNVNNEIVGTLRILICVPVTL